MASIRSQQTSAFHKSHDLESPSPKRVTAIDGQIGERLRAARVASGLTLDELAGALGVSYQLIQKYECGATRLSAARLIEAGRALSVPPSYFLTFDDGADQPVADAEVGGTLSANKHCAIRMITDAEEADVDVVRQLLQRLKRDGFSRAG